MKNKAIIAILISSLLILLLAVFVLVYSVTSFNSHERSITFTKASVGQTEKDIGLKISPRGGPQDIWIKQVDFVDSEGNSYSEQYAGITYDILLSNRTIYSMTNWKLSIPIDSPMFLNNAWCGKIEVNQLKMGKVSTQTVDLRQFSKDADTVTLRHLVSGSDLMIELAYGDSITYHPSIADNEDILYAPVNREDSTKTCGFIIYTKVDYTNGEKIQVPDFDYAVLTYNLTTHVTHKNSFIFITIFLIIWLFTAFFAIYKNYRNIQLEKRNKMQRAHDNEIIQQAMLAFIKFIDAKDSITKEHSIRVATYAAKLARAIGESEEQCENAYYIGLMHDCGKISIPDAILNKTGNLTEEEFEIMKTHALKGAEILNQFTSIPNIIDGAVYHHERWDGLGYPRGLKGTEIPLIGRIICIADAFDAMNSRRSYKSKMSPEEIKKEIFDNLGKKFDPEIGVVFLELLADGEIKF